MPQDTLLRALAVSAPLADSVAAHQEIVMRDGAADARTKWLCAAMVAGLNYCHPALVTRRGKLRDLGVDAETLTDLWDNARSDRYTPAQKAALAAAVALTREPRAMPEAVRSELRAHYDEAAIAELLCAIGLANYLDRVANALQTPMPKER